MPLLIITLLCGNFDADWSNAIRRDTSITPLRYMMEGITLFGDARTEAAFQIGVFYLGNGPVNRNAKLAVTSWAATGVADELIKFAVDRPRPDDPHPSRWDSSFPSGHVSSYFALATVYGAKYPKLIIPLAVIGAGVAYSRIYLGAHYPTDVLAGAALGVGIGWLTVKLEPQLRKIPFLR